MSEPSMTFDAKSGTVTIKIDVSPEALENAPPSVSGKSLVVASTHGNVRVGPVSIGLNCFVKNPKRGPPAAEKKPRAKRKPAGDAHEVGEGDEG